MLLHRDLFGAGVSVVEDILIPGRMQLVQLRGVDGTELTAVNVHNHELEVPSVRAAISRVLAIADSAALAPRKKLLWMAGDMSFAAEGDDARFLTGKTRWTVLWLPPRAPLARSNLSALATARPPLSGTPSSQS